MEENEILISGKDKPGKKSNRMVEDENFPVNPLRNKRIIVRHVPRQSGMYIGNPKHIAYGGMLESAKKTFCVPLRVGNNGKGTYVNVLTNNEKDYLEQIMGLENNALSIYKSVNNYWDNRSVTLLKQDNYFDLSVPEQYIDYKILLANKDYIAKSLQELEDNPKATYQFVIIDEGEEERKILSKMDIISKCYMELGVIKDDVYKMRFIVEKVDSRPIAKNTKRDVLQDKCNSLIQANSKLFYKIITDPLLDAKLIILKSCEAGIVLKRSDLYYIKEGNTLVPLCENWEESNLTNAAKYISNPEKQELKFTLEAKIKDIK